MNQHTPFNPDFEAIPAETLDVGGKLYVRDSQGRAVPLDGVKPVDKLMDEQVRKIIGFAIPLSKKVARFKANTFRDVEALMALIEQEYGAKRRGGKKGNMTITSFDGLLKVQVSVPDLVAFGPELQAAKSLIDECITEWGKDSRPEMWSLVTRAFAVDKQGQINRNNLTSLRSIQSEDERWQRAMQAVTDSERVIGSKTYIRFYSRPNTEAEWQPITIDIAQA